jgi:hypothetical protein
MPTSVRTGAAALAVVVGLMAGAPQAWAQASAAVSGQVSGQPPPSAEQVRLGMQLFEQMMIAMDFNALVTKGLTSGLAGPDGDFTRMEPKWRDFAIDAMNEEIKADHAALVTVMGRVFARNFSADELTVGLQVFRDPAMPVVMKALSAGQSAPAGVTLQTATLRALATPAGQSFAKKFGNIKPVMDGAQNDLAHVLLPGFFQRFADKAVALEGQRRQAEGLPAAGG